MDFREYDWIKKTVSILSNRLSSVEAHEHVLYILTNPSADHSAQGIKTFQTAGENLAFGEVCYVKNDGKLWKADANSGLLPGLYLALEPITADTVGQFLMYGLIRDDSWAWPVGEVLYVDDTAGAITHTAPGTPQPVGVALSATIIDFRPQI